MADEELSTYDQLSTPEDVRRARDPGPASELEDEGIPDLDEAPPGRAGAMDESEYVAPPRDHATAVEDYGTTAAEEATPESVADRAAREEPEVGVNPDGSYDDSLATDRPVGLGQLVDRDATGVEDAQLDEDLLDVTSEATAVELGGADGGYGAEEAAMHVTDELLTGEGGDADPTGGYGVPPGS